MKLSTEILALLKKELLLEAVVVDQQADTLAGGQLAGGVLLLDAGLATAGAKNV